MTETQENYAEWLARQRTYRWGFNYPECGQVQN